MIDSLLLATTRVLTFKQEQRLTNASGFFFARADKLFLVTSRHVLMDKPSQHLPDRIEIELHTDPENMSKSVGFSMLLYSDGKSIWRQGTDKAGDIDVAVIEIDRAAMPETAYYATFTTNHLQRPHERVEVGTMIQIVGFPLGFHDTLHHLPVVRHAGIASSFGLRFQGKGHFLTDARTHRGTSGAPVVMRNIEPNTSLGDLPWKILGIHSSRLDVGTRDNELDEALGLNCAWYADILLTLTDD
jgi:S1-C subfamily serine protease